MSELQNVQRLLQEAERAAMAGQFGSADALLRDVARIQEAELGPLHPELANTVNNLGIVAEKEGRLRDAETCYRRAVAIASASLPPDDPMVASSQKNLADFCRENQLPLELPAVVPSPPRTERPSSDLPAENTNNEVQTAPVVPAEVAVQKPAPVPVARSVPDPAAATGDRRPAPASSMMRPLAIAIGVVVLATAAILVMRARPDHDSPSPQSSAPAAQEPAPAVPSPPTEQPPNPSPPSHEAKSGITPPPAASPARSSDSIALVTSQLCRTFSIGGQWRCEPAGQTVTPGAIVLYTRVKSPHDAVVIHQWYRGDTLRKSARLSIRANTTEGYRTFSRQTVKRGENWRVEVRNTAGDVLYEQRVSVH